MKLKFVSFLLVALLVTSSFFELSGAGSLDHDHDHDHDHDDDDEDLCGDKCAERCSKAGRQDRCLKYCNICCKKCHCVPSGTYGHKDECPCYRDMKNSKGEPKCP